MVFFARRIGSAVVRPYLRFKSKDRYDAKPEEPGISILILIRFWWVVGVLGNKFKNWYVLK
jgi:hypothetical protein